jgi:hypothetical protein
VSFESDNHLPPRPNLLATVREFLELLGFRRVPPSPFPWRDGVLVPLSLHSPKPYESFSGVYLLIYRDQRPGLQVYARTNSWCSRWDLDQQIRTVRLLKKHFGGIFVTDAGTNRYWRNERPLLQSAEAGCLLAFERFQQSVSRAVHFLAEREFAPGWSDPGRQKVVLDHRNPRLFSNNLLLPYLVSAMEDYFKSTFVALARFSDNKESLFKQVRISADRLTKVSAGDATLEEVAAEGMSFQNLDSICGYFRMLSQRIDLAGRLRRPFRRRRLSLYDAVGLLVSRRHDLIHRNVVDASFEDDDVVRVVDDLYTAISKCYEHLVAVHGWAKGLQEPRCWTAKQRLRTKTEAT